MSNSDLFSFQTNGMNTTFSIRLKGVEKPVADSAVRSCFELLEQLENFLSRYRHDSDISRINQLQTGDELLIETHTHQCLISAMNAFQATQGLFDATLGRQVSHRKENMPGAAPAQTGQLKIATDRPLVQCLQAGRQLDLGGIGKGYALDQWAKLLKPLTIESALLSAGTSTHLALGSEAWPITMIYDNGQSEFSLSTGAFSVSGTQLQGNHLVHPDAPCEVALPIKQAWVAHPMATYADAYSTACLLMQPDELTAFFQSQPEISFLQAEPVTGQELIVCRS
jgi:thiamine biosynthesis lipoprotein